MSAAAVDQELIAPQYSNRLLQGLLVHLEETRGRRWVDEVVSEAGVPRAHLEDREGWVSTDYVRRLMLVLARRLYGLDALPSHHHPLWQHWRAAGWANVRPGVIGAMFPVVRALGSPEDLYRALPRLAERANRTLQLELEDAGGGRAVVTACPREPSSGGWTSANCWMLFGLMEAAPTMWGLGRARVLHPECMHEPRRPAERCRYLVSYESRRLWRWVTPVIAAAVGAGLGLGVGVLAGLEPLAWLAATGAIAMLALEGWRRYVRVAGFARRDVEQLGHVVEEADERYARLWEDERELRRSLLTATKLAGYLAPDLVERLVEDPETALTLGGRLTRAAVLFADIVGYTQRSEGRSPADVVDELNLYFSRVDPVVELYDGIIDKRIGDGVMVVFVRRPCEPDNGVDRRAVHCAVDMLRALEPLNEELLRTESPRLSIRIGLAAGELIQGNMGSPLRLEYTVIGDVVNVAARLESNATHDHVLVAAQMIAALEPTDRDGLIIGERKRIHVKGRQQPVEVVDVLLGDEVPSTAAPSG